MNKESLEIVSDKITSLLLDVRIPKEDKLELMLNLYDFLDPKKYNQNVKVLSLKRK